MALGPKTRRYMLLNRNPVAALLEQMDSTDKMVAREAQSEVKKIIGALAERAAQIIKAAQGRAFEKLDMLEDALTREFREAVRAKINSLPHLKGDSGYTPKKGKDYFDGKKGDTGDIPRAGVDYPSISMIEKMVAQELRGVFEKVKALSPTKEVMLGLVQEAMKSIDWIAVARGLETLQGKGRLDFLALKNRPGVDMKEAMERHTLHRGGGTSTPMSVSSGTIDDSNLVFTFTAIPKVVVVNGSMYRNGHGVAISGTTATLDNPVGTTGDIYGLK